MGLSVIILAGGTGTRMCSKQPKVLHELAAKPLLEHVIDSVHALNVSELFVVYGHMGDYVRSRMNHCDVQWIEQKERLGTGHAVLQVLPHLNLKNQVLILYGDVPLISSATLSHLVTSTGSEQLGLLTAIVDNPKGLGRIVRDEYLQVDRIVEERDATDLQKQIREINTGIYCVSAKHLARWLPQLKNDNSQKEYYLTDVVNFARTEGVPINVSKPRAVEEIYGANSRTELARLERIYQYWQAERLMAGGVSLVDPTRVDVRGGVEPAQDCWIDVNVVFEGRVVLGEDCRIGPNVVLKDVTLGAGVTIRANCVIEGATIAKGAVIGPFARIRPDTHIGEECHVGNFVELKQATLGQGCKVSHLSYMGDATLGEAVNIGAGTITCNYDGAHKHPTVIGDRVHIGSDVQLIAPVTVGDDATIGAGTTVMKDVPAGVLVVNPKTQQVVSGWKRPCKS